MRILIDSTLHWRDTWIEGGWDGTASSKDSKRIQDLEAVEKIARDELEPGTADRLQNDLIQLKNRGSSAGLEKIRDIPIFVNGVLML